MSSENATSVIHETRPHQSHRTISLLSCFGVLTLAAMGFVSLVHGQSYRGTINGTVTDQTGAAVAGVHVQVIQENTHFISATTTNAAGLYTVPFLMPGTYDVKVEATGFATAEQTGVVLIATDIKQVNFTVKPAPTSTTVTVTPNQQLLQTESATVSSVLTPNELHNAPNIDGNIYMMSTRVAGVYSNFTQNQESTQWWPVGGGVSGTTMEGLSSYQLTTMNGINILTPEGGPGQYTGYLPPPIGVQEVNVQTSPMDAEIGHTVGGVENSVLQTGTERLHAEASFLYGDTIFNSNTTQRTAASLPRVPNIWSQASFVVTGPVIIPKIYHGNHKTFFMAAYEHLNYVTASNAPFTPSVPTAKERTGDFSELSNAPGVTGDTGIIYDPTTTVPAGSSGAYAAWCSPNCVPGQRESFNQEYNEGPGANYIPSSRINPVGANILKYWPQPSQGMSANPSAPYLGNFQPVNQLNSPAWMWMGAFSIDEEFNQNNKLTVAFLPYHWKNYMPNFDYPIVNGYSGGPGYPYQGRFDWGGLIDYTKTLSPTMVLDLRAGGMYHPFVQPRPGDHMPLSVLGMTGNTLSFPSPNFPGVNVSGPFGGYASLTSGASIYDYSSLEDNYAVLSKSFQRHSFKTGFEYMIERADGINAVAAFAGSSGSPFTFNTLFTNSNPNSGIAAKYGGDGIASLLLGYPSGGAAAIVPRPAYEWPYWAVFAQDDWHVTSKLTLNLGLRYDYAGPITERHNQMVAGFDFSSTNPFNLPNPTGTSIASSNAPPPNPAVPQGYHGGEYLVNTPQWPSRGEYQREFSDRWQPRIGIAWHMLPNTVLRGGYGIFFAPNYPCVQCAPFLNGFEATTNFVASTNGNYTPASCTTSQGGDARGFCNISNPYPNGYVSPTKTLLGLSTGLGENLTFAGPSWLPMRDYIWTVGLEQQLPFQTMIDVEYHGNKINGIGVSKNWNALPNCYYYGGGCPNAGNATAINASVTNPMAGYMPSTSALNSAKTAQSNLYLPYPEFGTITQSNATVIPGTQQRIGLLLNNSLYLTVTKRTSHGLEFRVAATYEHVEDQRTLLNAGDPVTSAIKYDDPQPNRYLVGDLVYNLPKFNVNHALAYVVNDWVWSHSLNWQDGTSISVPGGAFPTGVSPVTHHQSLTHWFNTCYIPVLANVGQTYNGVVQTSPVYGQPTNCQFGEQPAWIQQPTMTLNQLNGNPMRGVRLQEVPYYDMALRKDIPIHEGWAFSVRVEAHNVLNNVLYGAGPNTSLTSPAFGADSPAATVNGTPNYGQYNDPRIIRFEARLSF